MRALIKRPVRIGDKVLECGAHTIDAALAEHWYFKALVSDGLAQIIDDPKPEPKPVPQPEAPAVAPAVKPAAQPAPAKPAQHSKPVKRAGKK
jgi:hypothetical protein